MTDGLGPQTPMGALSVAGCCCNIKPYHEANESTIVFDSGICNCGVNPRLASGNPMICTRAEYEAIAEKASTIGMDGRICCEFNCCGTPLCPHGWPLAEYQQTLNQEFPNFNFFVTSHYQGCDDQGHWEFIVTLRPLPGGTRLSDPPKVQVMENRGVSIKKNDKVPRELPNAEESDNEVEA
mmetsp:Transcript_16150/g.23753  ORF Transcript_16150/g.23753 Transcript_16150/m.23753 type:complete len:181 (+) Transcript_16150:182-724(+)|eukprot:CAMPEP_0194214064 /NCGR_PEP_ID=MMETSP0156-20130528/15113_1 /TAXON_ID=33649 /ORGANISM="Thalassionema nitzschioides, Strain L26-B" /LENGTH=180 /DNA_ID=CAMNT_0038942245 /DNA_START=148 /DNA_END=690 /DNA_ORIENTATION=+